MASHDTVKLLLIVDVGGKTPVPPLRTSLMAEQASVVMDVLVIQTNRDLEHCALVLLLFSP